MPSHRLTGALRPRCTRAGNAPGTGRGGGRATGRLRTWSAAVRGSAEQRRRGHSWRAAVGGCLFRDSLYDAGTGIAPAPRAATGRSAW